MYGTLRRMFFAIIAILVFALTTQAYAQNKIVWNESSATLIHANAGYGRIARIGKDEIICCFDSGGKIWVRTSRGNGASWESPTLVADCSFGIATNPEILQLADGVLLCSYNERPTDGTHPFAILVSSSKDRGQTWSSSRRLYTADRQFENGCWEPAAIQLPSGEVQLFFANENPYRTSAEQDITMLRSMNSGATWDAPKRVSFRQGKRDGMPVPLVLKGKKGIVFAIEDNGIGEFKPAIVYTSLKDNWKTGVVDGGSARRWSALKQPLPASVYAGAPYICQMPNGETILSIQSKEGGRSEPRMVVYVGDGWARDFANPSVPFGVPENTPCLWNSLFAKDKDTVIAISGTRLKGTFGLWSIEGRLVRDGEKSKAQDNIVQIWQHRVEGGPPQLHRFYPNGKINNSNGVAEWSIRGKTLTMKWPNEKAPGGAWIDRCTLSLDGRSYAGENQSRNKITGELSQRRD